MTNDINSNRIQGFVLVATLWTLLVMTLVVGFIGEWIARSLETSQQGRINRDYLIAEQSSRANLLYLMSTRRMSVAGITTWGVLDTREIDDGGLSTAPVGGEFRLDGTIYELEDGTQFSLQDQRGLINLNFGSHQMLQQFLLYKGVSFQQRQQLLASLSDYIDEDDLFRINGAERNTYADISLPGPANHVLNSPLEIRQVYGWQRESIPLSDATIARFFSTVRDAQLNINAAPLPVLLSLPGMTVETARRIQDMRTQTPFLSYIDVATRSGAFSADQLSGYVVFPSNYLSLRIWHPDITGSERYFGVKLTPFKPDSRPWTIFESRGIQLNQGSDEFEQSAEPAEIPAPALHLFSNS